jgi:predicted enzyme related to lactoylglutathione lyase
MHKSRLGTVVIDCQTEQVDTAADFWSKALGWPSEPLSDPNDSNYRELEGYASGAQPKRKLWNWEPSLSAWL